MAEEVKEEVESTEVVGVEQVEEKEALPTVEELQRLYDEERATKARILEEKKSAKSKLAEMEEQLNKYTTEEKQRKMAELDLEERYKMMLEEKDQELNKYKTSFTEKEHAYNTLQRKIKLNEVSGDIRFKSDIPTDIRTFAIDTAFAEVDLDDPTAIRATKRLLTEKYKGMIVSDAPKGAGSDPATTAKPVTSSDEMTPEEYLALSKAERSRLSESVRKQLWGKG